VRIAVLVKEVPDTWGKRTLNLESGLAERASGDRVLDEIAERSIEVALDYAENDADTEVILVSMGPDYAAATLRKGLAMGAHSAIHIVDDGLRGADLSLTAEVLAEAIRRLECDLVIAGNLSTDGVAGVLPAMVSEHLGVPQLSYLSSVSISATSVSGVRSTEAGTLELSADLPVVVSVTEAMPDGRLPSFKGIMAAKKKPFDVWTLSDLGIDPESGDSGRSIITAVSERPPRGAGVKVVDEGDGGVKLATFLKDNKLV